MNKITKLYYFTSSWIGLIVVISYIDFAYAFNS